MPFDETAYVATYVEGERVTLLFPLANTGRVPVRVTEVFPEEDRLLCGWSPDRIETSASTAGDYRPFKPFWLSPHEIVNRDAAIKPSQRLPRTPQDPSDHP